jgi:hypothetical protein
MAQARQAGELAGRQAAGLRRCLCRATSTRHYLHTLAPNSSKRPRGGICSGVVCLGYGSRGLGRALRQARACHGFLFSSTSGARRFGACETRALLWLGTAVQGTVIQSSVSDGICGLRSVCLADGCSGTDCPSGGGEDPRAGPAVVKGMPEVPIKQVGSAQVDCQCACFREAAGLCLCTVLCNMPWGSVDINCSPLRSLHVTVHSYSLVPSTLPSPKPPTR